MAEQTNADSSSTLWYHLSSIPLFGPFHHVSHPLWLLPGQMSTSEHYPSELCLIEWKHPKPRLEWRTEQNNNNSNIRHHCHANFITDCGWVERLWMSRCVYSPLKQSQILARSYFILQMLLLAKYQWYYWNSSHPLPVVTKDVWLKTIFHF